MTGETTINVFKQTEHRIVLKENFFSALNQNVHRNRNVFFLNVIWASY